MNCDDVRLIYLADPREADAASATHLAQCPACQAFVREIQPLDDLMKQAIEVPVPVDLRSRLQQIAQEPAVEKNPSWGLGGLAMAASMVLAIGLVVMNLDTKPTPSLDRLVYDHVGHENFSLVAHDISPDHIESEMHKFGMKMKVPGSVTFVERCPIGDTYGLHLVYENAAHNVTFIYLPDIEVEQPQGFSYGDLHGVIRPAPKGSLAIVGDKNLDLDATNRAINHGIEWL